MTCPNIDLECCYSPCCSEGETSDEIENTCGWVTCNECGWSAYGECAEGNGWDASDEDGNAWCDECKPDDEN